MKGRETTEKDKICLLAIWKQSAFKKVQVTWFTAKKASPAPTALPMLVENEGTEGKKVWRFFSTEKQAKIAERSDILK